MKENKIITDLIDALVKELMDNSFKIIDLVKEERYEEAQTLKNISKQTTKNTADIIFSYNGQDITEALLQQNQVIFEKCLKAKITN